MSAPTDEQWKKIGKLVDLFYNRADSEPFREPVDWKGLGLTDYPKVIKTPMDLGTIRNKLKSKQYKTLFQVGEDVRLVWTNCMTYNADGSDFYKLADMLHRKWDEKYNKLLQECSTSAAAAAAATAGSASGPAAADATGSSSAVPEGGATAAPTTATAASASKVTLQEKRNFAKSLFSISKEDLGRILVEVEAKCPIALTRNSAEDEVELNVDKLTPSLLQELTKFVDSSKAGKGSGGGTGGTSSKKKTGTSTSAGGTASVAAASTGGGASNKKAKTG